MFLLSLVVFLLAFEALSFWEWELNKYSDSSFGDGNKETKAVDLWLTQNITEIFYPSND